MADEHELNRLERNPVVGCIACALFLLFLAPDIAQLWISDKWYSIQRWNRRNHGNHR